MTIAGGLKSVSKKIGTEAVKASGRFAKGAIKGFFDSLGIDPDQIKKTSKVKPKSSLTPKKKNNVSVGISKSTPKKAKLINNPTLSSIDSQIREINKTLLSIKKTQSKDLNAKLSQAVKESRLEREHELEAANDNEPDAIREEGDGPEIGTLQNSLDGFMKSLDEAIDKLNNLDLSSGGSFFGSGFGRKPKTKKPKNTGTKPQKLPKGIDEATDLLDKNGKTLTGAARASRIEKLVKERGLIKGGFGGGARALGKLTKEKIGAIARPLLSKAGLKLTAKSIPILGAGLGLAFAVSRLVDGDIVGAGLEAVSGIGSVATAIPATITAIARDIYHDTYGVQPEEDPQGKERFAALYGMVKQIAIDEFVSQKKEESTSKKATSAAVANFKPLSDNSWDQAWKQTAGHQATNVTKPPVTNVPSNSSPVAPTKKPESGGGSSGSMSSSESQAPSAPVPQASLVPSTNNGGTQIQDASMSVEKVANEEKETIVNNHNVFPNQSAPMPNEISSHAAPVPDPSYYTNNIDLIDQLYFTAMS